MGVSYRIALQEETNRMSANALAIVFAPCILRCPDTIDPLQSVQDISKTTAYVMTLCWLALAIALADWFAKHYIHSFTTHFL